MLKKSFNLKIDYYVNYWGKAKIKFKGSYQQLQYVDESFSLLRVVELSNVDLVIDLKNTLGRKAINDLVLEYFIEFFQNKSYIAIHGALLNYGDGHFVAICGPGGSGKTLSALKERNKGAEILSDDIFFLGPEDLMPLPKPICVKYKEGIYLSKNRLISRRSPLVTFGWHLQKVLAFFNLNKIGKYVGGTWHIPLFLRTCDPSSFSIKSLKFLNPLGYPIGANEIIAINTSEFDMRGSIQQANRLLKKYENVSNSRS
jgi:hypothetical protein